jgi:hypothetical protein
MTETNFDFNIGEHEIFSEIKSDFEGNKPTEDPFIREFFAFCKNNNMQEKAAQLLGKKIEECKK